MKYYNREVIDQVRQLDLLSYLKNYEPDEVVEISRGNYCTKEHDSLKISNGKWYWFSKGIGGYNALDYLIKVKGYEFMQAMEIILNHTNIMPPVKYEFENKIKSDRFILPEENVNNDRAINYLISRGIDKDIINECIDNNLIYEEKGTHNVVFIGNNLKNEPGYAALRGTGNTRFMKEAYDSDKKYSFKLESMNNSEELHLFECAIDLLSYATFLKRKGKEWYNLNLLSLAGVYRPANSIEDSKVPLALNLFLYTHKNIKRICLHLDNDTTGRLASMALKLAIPNSIYKDIEVIDDPPKYGKDYNDFLIFELKKMRSDMERER